MNTLDTTALRRDLEKAKRDRERLFTEIENLRARSEADGETAGLEERIGNLNRGLEAADERVEDLEREFGRASYVERLAQDPRNLVRGDDGGPPKQHEDRRRGPQISEARDQALRTLERHGDSMDSDRPDALERLIRGDTARDWTSRFLNAVGNPHYRTAFGKLMADPQHGHLRFTPEEVEAVRVSSAVEMERALSIGSGAGGGFLLPFQLDPSIVLSSSGALNPVRQLARVETVTANEWRGVTSDGVTVAYSAEAAVMTDGSPVLAQPVITCRRWTAFVPYSWELGQDDPGLQNQLVQLIADGRDVNDSSVFSIGTSTSNQPNGLFPGLSATQVVLTAGTATLVAGDVWNLKANVPARFFPNTTFAAPPAAFDRIYRLTPAGGTTEPPLMDSRAGPLIGKPISEWSYNAGTSVATGGTIAVAGDFQNYLIADRLGLTAVPVPTLFGGTAGVHYPTGESGLAVWGRTGGGVLVANAFRALVGR